MRHLKILYVVNSLDFLMSHRQNLLRAALSANYEVHLAAPPSEKVAALEALGCRFHAVALSRKGINPISEFRAIRDLYRVYRSLQPDLIHHVTIKPIIYGGVASRFAKIPATVNAVSGLGHIYISQSLKTRVIRLLTNLGYALSARHPKSRFIFQNSEDEQFFIAKRLVAKDHAFIIPGSGVCMREYRPLPMPPLDPLVIVLAGRMIKEKGIVEFVQAAKEITVQKNQLKFVLVGDIDPGNPSSLNQAQIEAWVNAGFVEWWGYQQDIRAVYAKAHIVCLPSYREGSPRALIEAAALARPLITTDTPGCRDLVKPGVNGLLVPVGNIKALVAAILKLTTTSEVLETMGQASRTLVERRYAQDLVLKQTLMLYRNLHQEKKTFEEVE